jgi:hypothetical protein
MTKPLRLRTFFGASAIERSLVVICYLPCSLGEYLELGHKKVGKKGHI